MQMTQEEKRVYCLGVYKTALKAIRARIDDWNEHHRGKDEFFEFDLLDDIDADVTRTMEDIEEVNNG